MGTLIFSKGDKYVGEWKAGEKHGQGELHYVNGDVFRGQWAADKANGYGVLTYRHGGKYEGDWVNDKVRYGCGYGQGTVWVWVRWLGYDVVRTEGI